jgi:hypothetical protein
LAKAKEASCGPEKGAALTIQPELLPTTVVTQELERRLYHEHDSKR